MARTGGDEASRPRAYWRSVLGRTLVLLGIWLLAGPILGILLVDTLNNARLRGVPLGFWIAQQGAIYVFVVLIFVYAWLSERADRGESGAGTQSATAAESRGG
jgi:putative solute:sodium symporter small subunit